MKSRSTLLFSALLTLFAVIFLFSIFGEKVPYNDGAGWDGVFYRDVTQNFTTDFFRNSYDSFRIQRIFPFFIINILLSIFSIEPTHTATMNTMLVLLCLNMAVLVIYFFKLARLLQWPTQIAAVLFSCLFLNFFFLKSYGYEPFQTDSFAITFSLASYYYLLRNKPLISFASSLPAAFCWPTIPFIVLILIALRNQPSDSEFRYHPPIHFAAPAYILAPFAFTWLMQLIHSKVSLSELLMSEHSLSFYALNALITSVFLFFVLKVVQKIGIPSPCALWRHFDFKILILPIILFLMTKGIVAYFSSGENYYSSSLFLLQMLIRPLKYPLVFLVNHITAWGIFFALILCRWNDFSEIFLKKSFGHAIVFFVFCLFLLDSESRHITFLLPILLYPLGETLKKTNLTSKGATILVGAQIFLSHFYYRVNQPDLAEIFERNELSHPLAQRYFMNFGPWLTTETYLFWAAISILTLLLVIFVIKKSKN